DSSSDGTKFQSKIKSEMGLNNSVTSSSTISIPNPLDMLCDDEIYETLQEESHQTSSSEQKSNY
ncbi:MAG: hypothetical protein ACRD5J_02510, partial [Nitrososphaeraceae archaeon]